MKERVFEQAFILIVGIVIGFGLGNRLNTVVADPPNVQLSPCFRPEIDRDNIRILVNEERLKLGHNQLGNDPLLERYAQLRAEEIGKSPDKVSHETKYVSFTTWGFNEGYELESIYESVGGEILVSNHETACSSIQAFMDSSTHRDIMLNKSSNVFGIGINGPTIVIITGTEKR